MTTATTTVKVELRGLLSMKVPITEEALVGLIEKLDQLTDERKRELHSMGVRFSMELGAFEGLCRHHLLRLQQLQQPLTFHSVVDALNLLRELGRQDETITVWHKSGIESIGDRSLESQFTRMVKYMELVGVSPDAIVIRCPN